MEFSLALGGFPLHGQSRSPKRRIREKNRNTMRRRALYTIAYTRFRGINANANLAIRRGKGVKIPLHAIVQGESK